MNEENKSVPEPGNDSTPNLQQLVQGMIAEELKKNAASKGTSPAYSPTPSTSSTPPISSAPSTQPASFALPTSPTQPVVASQTPTTTKAPAPSPVPPLTEAPVPPSREPVPARETLNPNFLQKPIRTYESDLAAAVGKKQVSVASIAVAENNRKIETQKAVLQQGPLQKAEVAKEDVYVERKPYLKQFFIFLLSIVFLGGGAYGGYYLYQQSPFAKPAPVPVQIMISTIIPTDKTVSLVIPESLAARTLVSRIHTAMNDTSANTGDVIGLSLLERDMSIESTDATVRVPVTTFIDRTNLNMPDIITRSIVDRFMMGAYVEEDGMKSPFLALTTDFFQNVFAGMLSWEDTMSEDLSDIMGYRARVERGNQEVGDALASYFNIQGSFSDKVIRNRDVREFRTPNGELLLLYSFINKETLIITTTESAFLAILDRIEKQAFVR